MNFSVWRGESVSAVVMGTGSVFVGSRVCGSGDSGQPSVDIQSGLDSI